MRLRRAPSDPPTGVREGSDVGDGHQRGVGASLGTGGPPSLAAPPLPLGDYRHTKVGYPPDVRSMGFGGEVWVQLDIDERGSVVSAAVVKSFSHGFDPQALEITRRIRFNPALDDLGRPIAARIIWRIHFVPQLN
jgi:TonB family protein